MDYTLWLLTAGYGLRSLQSKLPNYEAYFLHYMLAIILGKEMKTQFPESCIHHCWSNTQFFNVIFSPLGNTDPRHRKRRERGGASYQITKHVTKPAWLLDSISGLPGWLFCSQTWLFLIVLGYKIWLLAVGYFFGYIQAGIHKDW